MMSSYIKDIPIITIKGADYRCIIYGISKSKATHLRKNPKLDDRGFIQNSFQRSQY